ncbi:MAG TPA: tripartite tricarboxylate transporter permease, partial [Clostridiaceae bacterium]|nr:tripartite tricarboxylate transporter permease [Clostridiaceae bacterium]
MIELLAQGFLNVLSFEIIALLILGVMIGIAIGSLPGLTATMGVALILPITFKMESLTGILMLLGVYCGAMYGGSISAILLKTPGTPAAAATIFDGFAMSQKGEAGRALGISAVASFGGGLISVIALILISPQLAKVALRFSAPEFFGLAVFGLSIIASISGKSMIKGLLAGVFGLLLSTIGIDLVTGFPRFTFGNMNLFNGLAFIPVMIGLFAMSQAFTSIEHMLTKKLVVQKVGSVLPSKADMKQILPSILRGGIIGTMIGIIPGAGGEIGAFVSYNEAKRWSKHPEKFGTGIVEGIAAPEAGNNGVTGGAMIPLLTLGIPGDAVTAILLGALMIQGLQPGPLLFTEHAGLVYTIFVGFLLANIFMLILGLFGAKYFAKVISIPSHILTPVIFVLCIVGSYAINNNFFDVMVMFGFGALGYVMEKTEFPVSPIVLALILGPMAERELRKALMMSNGSISILFTRPISLILIGVALLTLFMPIIKGVKEY